MSSANTASADSSWAAEMPTPVPTPPAHPVPPQVAGGAVQADVVSPAIIDAARGGEVPSDGLTDGLDVETLWQARPWLAQVYRRARAAQLSPFSVLFSVLARLSTAVPPNVVAEHPGAPKDMALAAPLSLFVAIVGDPGGGKGAAGRVAADLVPDLRGATTTQPASGEGLAAMYVRRVPATDGDGKKMAGTRLEYVNCRALLDVPEIRTLGGVADRRGATIVPTLASAWSGEELGAFNKGEADRLRVPARAYRLSLIAGVQRGNADVLLCEADTGLPQRFLWADTIDRTAPRKAPEVHSEDMVPLDLPATFADSIPRGTWQEIYAGTAGAIRPGTDAWPLVIVTFPDAVRDQARTDGDARLHGEIDAAQGHMFQLRCRLAAVLALYAGRRTVSMEDWELAGIMTAYSDRVRRAAIEGQRQADADARAQRLETQHDADLKAAQGCMLRWMARNPLRAPHTGSAIISKGAGRWGAAARNGLAEQALSDAAERGLIECAEPAPADPETGEPDGLDMRRSRWSLTDKGRAEYPLPKK